MISRKGPLVSGILVSCLLVAGPVLAQTPEQPAPTPAPTPPAPAPAPAPTPAAPLAQPSAPVTDEVKIVVDNKAKSDGEIRFRFAPEGGEAKEVRITIQKGMSKQDVCRDITKELSVALGSSYEVKHYDDDKVKVTEKKEAKFSLTVASMTVQGLSVQLK